MAKLEIVKDSEGNKIVLIPEILFFNKQNIEWELVEQYLEKYVGEIVEIAETREVVYIHRMHRKAGIIIIQDLHYHCITIKIKRKNITFIQHVW